MMAKTAKTAKRPKRKKAEGNGVAVTPMPALDRDHLDISTLETWLWDGACAIRGATDAPKFKDFILPLIFFKRLSDVFDDEFAGQRMFSGGSFDGRKAVGFRSRQYGTFARPPPAAYRTTPNESLRVTPSGPAGDRGGGRVLFPSLPCFTI